MMKLSLSSRTSKFFILSTTVSLTLSTVATTHAVAASLFNFNFDGTLSGADPFGSTATSQKINGSFLLDADIANDSTTPVAGRYNGAIRGLTLNFESTPGQGFTTLSAADFPGERNRVFVGARGAQEELQFLYGNVATQPPFFQPRSVGVIFSSRDLPLTTQLKEVLKPATSRFDGEFKLVLSPDQVETPNNLFSGSISITPVPEPRETLGSLVALGFAGLFATRLRGKNRKPKFTDHST